MALPQLLLVLAGAALLSGAGAKIGYFWHITDFHYDPLYSPLGDTRRRRYLVYVDDFIKFPLLPPVADIRNWNDQINILTQIHDNILECRRADDRGSSGHHRALGRFGDYACDSPLALVESAARHMRTRHPDNVEFVLWTGDIVAAGYGGGEERMRAMRNMTELLGRTFSSHFVFPVLGHLEPPPSGNLTGLWGQWLPLEAMQTFQTGGYYTIEQTHSKLRIVVLNTNLFSSRESNAGPAREQGDWLDSVLDTAAKNNEMVYIVGHAAPGAEAGARAPAPAADARYLRAVRRHARSIAGQFFGHLHADTFRVIYDQDRPVSWALLAPAVSPRREPAGASNPGLRLYKFDTNSGTVLDYTQYYLDLEAANRAGVAEWAAEYNLTQHYSLPGVTAAALHSLAERLRSDVTVLNKYTRAYSVRHSAAACDGACAQQHYCAVTSVELGARRACVAAAAGALAAAARAAAPPLAATLPLIFALLLLL